jgi:hypothetical protein
MCCASRPQDQAGCMTRNVCQGLDIAHYCTACTPCGCQCHGRRPQRPDLSARSLPCEQPSHSSMARNHLELQQSRAQHRRCNGLLTKEIVGNGKPAAEQHSIVITRTTLAGKHNVCHANVRAAAQSMMCHARLMPMVASNGTNNGWTGSALVAGAQRGDVVRPGRPAQVQHVQHLAPTNVKGC